ncbi:protein unc-93 homolog A [Strongylocentrotus purpuratus]|uniref:UNC93-like protein n=1 Tax=Strongylocentrotus purpuratus TaxID=7668 RepID=A0A7M7RFZ6_STRPU|nr:protein unc-93 homolog A [Strongylocentrotus purpuratus]
MTLHEDVDNREDPQLKKEMAAAEFSVIGDDQQEDDENLASSWTTRKIYKNLLLISSAFLFVFTAFQALSNLQSSINCVDGLGLASLSTIYASLIVSAMLIPSVMIRHLGLKWTLVLSEACYAIYTAANFYPSWATLIPASVLLGFGAAPLWTAKSTYLTTMAGAYSKLTGETVPSIVSRFWGIFFFFFQSSQILGNLISSLVFRQETSFVNSTQYKCGSQDCYVETGDENGTYCDPPEESLTYTLLSIYLVSGVIAVVIVVVFVDNLGASRKIKDQGTFDLFCATARLMKDKKLILIIPLTIYSGLEQAFITGDFTKSYVTCSLGVGWVGYIMICYGVADALCSVLFGRFVKYTGQVPLFCLGAIINLSLIIALFIWEPRYEELPVFFVIAAAWGVADAIWQTQLNALYGILFLDEQEQAYSNYRLWESVGFSVAFAYSNFLCVWIKLTILVCVLGAGMLGYAGAELVARRDHREK